VTKERKRCAWCGGVLPPSQGLGRPRTYCKQGCRQQAHIARKLAKARGLDEDEVLVSRAALEHLQGLLYGVQAALEDVDSDLGSDESQRAYKEAFTWLRDACEPLAEFWIEPKAL
jgi:hypothetical protein